MRLLSFLFSKKWKLLNIAPAEKSELNEIERKAYMETARDLVKERGIMRAKEELGINKKENRWDIK